MIAVVRIGIDIYKIINDFNEHDHARIFEKKDILGTRILDGENCFEFPKTISSRTRIVIINEILKRKVSDLIISKKEYNLLRTTLSN